jgi:hypothetical protein
MSRSLSSAKQRRAGLSPQAENPRLNPNAPTSTVNGQQGQQGPQGGLTLPQVIALVDARLTKLETFQKKTESNPMGQNPQIMPTISEKDDTISNLSEIIDDFQNRFIMLATEIGAVKDTIMKLQTYTMDVNKMLLEERVNILSDLGDDNKSLYVMQNTDLQENEVECLPENVVFENSE